MASELAGLTPEDHALLDRLAGRIVELHMEVPAVLALESAKPLTVVASQALIFFEPLVQAFFRFTEYRRFTTLIERRDVMESLTQRIEAGAERTRAERDAARRAARGGPRQT
jgi:hypothetical protein